MLHVQQVIAIVLVGKPRETYVRTVALLGLQTYIHTTGRVGLGNGSSRPTTALAFGLCYVFLVEWSSTTTLPAKRTKNDRLTCFNTNRLKFQKHGIIPKNMGMSKRRDKKQDYKRSISARKVPNVRKGSPVRQSPPNLHRHIVPIIYSVRCCIDRTQESSG